ncbi:MAG: hypothetical protein HPY68_02610 [Candidatus Atribacteria bacterium]|nr:hypothetical protein [Candidatus Atribacteria bacterium]
MNKKLFLLIFFLVFLFLTGCGQKNSVTTGQESLPTASPTTQAPGHQDFIK